VYANPCKQLLAFSNKLKTVHLFNNIENFKSIAGK